MTDDIGSWTEDDWFNSDYMDADDYRNVHGASSVGDFTWGTGDSMNAPTQTINYSSDGYSSDGYSSTTPSVNTLTGNLSGNIFGDNTGLMANAINASRQNNINTTEEVKDNTLEVNPIDVVTGAFGNLGDNILKYNKIAGEGIEDTVRAIPGAYSRAVNNAVKAGKTVGNVLLGDEYFDENKGEFIDYTSPNFNYPGFGQGAEAVMAYAGGAGAGLKAAQGAGHVGKYLSAIGGGTATTDPTENNMSNFVEGTDFNNPLTKALSNTGVTKDSSSVDKLGQYGKNFTEELLVSGPIDFAANKFLNRSTKTNAAPKEDIAGLLDVERTGDRLGILGDEKPTPQMSLIPDTGQKLSDGRYIYNGRMYEPNMSKATPASFPEGGAYGYHSSSNKPFDMPDPDKQIHGNFGKGHYVFTNQETADLYPGWNTTKWQYDKDFLEKTVNFLGENSLTVDKAFDAISKKTGITFADNFHADNYQTLSKALGERETQALLRSHGVIGNRGGIGNIDGGAVMIYSPEDLRQVIDTNSRAALNVNKAQIKADAKLAKERAELNKPQAQRNDLNLYSVLEEKLLRLPQETNLSADVKTYLNKQGVKTNELEDTGILNYLDENKTVTKKGLLDHFGANKTELDETVLGRTKDGKPTSVHDEDAYNAARQSLMLDRPQDTLHPDHTPNYTVVDNDNAGIQADEFIAGLKEGKTGQLGELKQYLNAPMYGNDYSSFTATTTQVLHETVEEAVNRGTLDMLPDSVMNKVETAAFDMFEARYQANPVYEWNVGNDTNRYVVLGNKEQGYVVQGPDDTLIGTADNIGEAEVRITSHAQSNGYFPETPASGNRTRFQAHTTPNLDEKSYREVLITTNNKGEAFLGPHYDEENLLGHIRLSDKYDVNGNKVLFVEEAQSDWLQHGRVVGFTVEENAAKLVQAEKAVDEAKEYLTSVQKELNNFVIEGRDVKAERAGQDALIDKLDKAQQAKSEAGDTLWQVKDGPVVPAPMKTDGIFNDLAMKRVVEIAREEGYHSVALATPNQQLDLYNTMVDGVRSTNADGTVRYAELYNNIYGNKLPASLSKMANKHGGETGKVEIVQNEYDLHEKNTFHDSITLTPEFKENIRGGQTLYDAGGVAAAGALLQGDINENTPVQLGEGLDRVGGALEDLLGIDGSNITTRDKGVMDMILSGAEGMNDEELD
nr:hypothetical protein [Candidatus Thioglobus sp.]